MNKEDAKRRLKVIELESQRLQEMIEAPEKPKLRHGDWWLTKGDKGDVRIFMKEYNGEKRDCVALRCTLITNIGSEYEGQPILGNVFDLMKGWDEPLIEFKLDVHRYFIDKRTDMAHAPIYMAGNWHTLSEVEEHHSKLGRLIVTFKRKENKSD